MPEAEITDKTIIVVDEVGTNQYGDLTWIDKEGKFYKVKSTRKEYFEAIAYGQSVEIKWSTFKGTKYPYSATAVKDKIAERPSVKVTLPVARHPDEMPAPEAPQSKSSPVKPLTGIMSRDEHKSSQETGMWWKEAGLCLRSGLIEPESLYGKARNKCKGGATSRKLSSRRS